jgi:hypothetical protein
MIINVDIMHSHQLDSINNEDRIPQDYSKTSGGKIIYFLRTVQFPPTGRATVCTRRTVMYYSTTTVVKNRRSHVGISIFTTNTGRVCTFEHLKIHFKVNLSFNSTGLNSAKRDDQSLPISVIVRQFTPT